MSKSPWAWLQDDDALQGALRTMSAEQVAERFGAELAKVDDRVGVEVTDRSGTREVLLTAGGDADAFGRVRELVAGAPAMPGWAYVALRPGRGFEFDIEVGGRMFPARALSFVALEKGDAPTSLAIRLLVPNPEAGDWAEAGLSVIEAGVGEEAAARIGYLEIGKREDDTEGVYAIESLEGWIGRQGGAG